MHPAPRTSAPFEIAAHAFLAREALQPVRRAALRETAYEAIV
jgi:hypothetical protein